MLHGFLVLVTTLLGLLSVSPTARIGAHAWLEDRGPCAEWSFACDLDHADPAASSAAVHDWWSGTALDEVFLGETEDEWSDEDPSFADGGAEGASVDPAPLAGFVAPCLRAARGDFDPSLGPDAPRGPPSAR